MRKVFLLVSAMLTVTAILSCIKDNTEQSIILSVKHCGAVADGVTLDTQAIQSAIDRVSSSGGGTVLVPSGVYLTGSIWLKDNVNLYLKEGAVIKGSPDIDDYCAADCCPQNEAEIGWGDYMSGGHLILGVEVSNGKPWSEKSKIPVRPSVAALYGVETKRVNEAVRNNPDKFPLSYSFELKPSSRCVA